MITVAYTRNRSADVGLFILRVVVGMVFFAHGWQKFFMLGIDGVIAGFGQMGVPMPHIVAPAIAVLELAGGLALILGLWTRIFGALLAIEMVAAILLVHVTAGFFLPAGMEFALTLFAASLCLAISGAGAISVDGVLWRDDYSPVTTVDEVVTRERRPTTIEV